MKNCKKDEGILYLCLFAAVTLVAAFIFVPYLVSGKAFILGWDMHSEYISMFEELRTMMQDLVHRGRLPFWSWTEFLGNDFWSSKLFYFDAPLDYVFALTDLPYVTIVMIETYLRFLIAGFGFAAYARYSGFSRRPAFISALMFTFSAYLVQIMMHPFLASFVALLPLYFLAVDHCMKEGRCGRLIFMVFFMLLDNYYMFYSLALFSVIYCIWRYDDLWGSWKNFGRMILKLLCCGLAGGLLSCFAVLPEALSIMNNARVGSRSVTFLYDSMKPYLGFLVALFTPTSALTNRNTAIQDLYYSVTENQSVLTIHLWASSLMSLLFFQQFRRERRDRVKMTLMVILSLLILIPAGSSLMHGFSEPSFRWLAPVTFLNIVWVLPMIEHPETVSLPFLRRTMILIGAALLLSPWLLSLLTGKDFRLLQSDLWLYAVFFGFLVLTRYAWQRNGRHTIEIVLLAELCTISYLSYYGSGLFSKYTLEEVNAYTEATGEKDELNRFLYSLDDSNPSSFYRVYVDRYQIYGNWSYNLDLNGNIMGLMTYDSTFNSSSQDLRRLTMEEDYLPWVFGVTDSRLMDLLSVKYALAMTDDHVPFASFHQVGSFRGMNVYENDDYSGLGKTYGRAVSYEDYSGDPSETDSAVICQEKDLAEINSLLGDSGTAIMTAVAGDNRLYAYCQTQEPGFAVLSVPYHKGWRVTVNGQEVKTYQVSGGLTGIAVAAGDNEIQMYFMPRGLKAGLLLSGIGAGLALLLTIVRRRPKTGPADDGVSAGTMI